MKTKFYYYYLRLFNDFMLFSDDVDEVITFGRKIIEEEQYLDFLKFELTNVFSEINYPEEQINNLGIILNYLKKVNKTPKLDEVSTIYEKIKTKRSQNSKYIDEANKKIYNIKNFNDVLEIEPKMIKFDFYVYDSLLNDKKIVESDYYFTSLKKFLIDFPDMFNDKKILNKAYEMIETQPIKKETNKIREEVIYYLTHHKKEIIEGFNQEEVSYAYTGIILQNMLADYKMIEKYKYYISNILIETLDLFIDNSLIASQSEKNNALEIITIYKEKMLKQEHEELKGLFIEKINSSIIKLNKVTIRSDIKRRFDLMLRGLKDSYYNSDLSINDLIKNDLLLLEYLSSDKEIEINDNNIYLSVNKLVNIMPCIFEDLEVKEKTINLLKENRSPKIMISKIKKINKKR